MESTIFGLSRLQIPIPCWNFGKQGPRVLLLGGVHGDEPEGVTAAHGILSHFLSNFDYRLKLTLVPMLNADGVILHQRTNGAGVDLNRNLPTKDWTSEARAPRYNPGEKAGSEPENQAITKFIEIEKPQLIISFHSWEPMINVNGDCKGEADIIAKLTGYRVTDDIGYPTPGSLGTYAGQERKIPTITYEIQREMPLNQVIANHVRPALEALRYTEAHR